MMGTKAGNDESVDINFESHPPIDDDLNGVAALLRQSFLQFVDCQSIAAHLITLKDTTQVIAQESPEEDNVSDDEEPDDDIYGVVSVIDLPISRSDHITQDEQSTSESVSSEVGKKLLKFVRDKCSRLKEDLDVGNKSEKYGMIINERYINLPPQLALPTFKTLTSTLDGSRYTHLIFMFKILLKAKSEVVDPPSKKVKITASSSKQHESLIYVNPEEEIIFEKCDYHTDIDVSAHCDENATWSFSSDVKYLPHRRICVMDYKKWPEVLSSFEEELK